MSRWSDILAGKRTVRHPGGATFFAGTDTFSWDTDLVRLRKKYLRMAREDRKRLRREGDALPKAIYANPVLAEAKRLRKEKEHSSL